MDVETDLTITGKPAQFGRGVMAEISGKLITQFADCLADTIASPEEPSSVADSAPAADEDPSQQPAPQTANGDGGAPPTTAPTVTPPLRSVTPTRPTPEAIDLLGAAGLPVLKRLAPLLAVFGVVLVVLAIRRRHR